MRIQPCTQWLISQISSVVDTPHVRDHFPLQPDMTLLQAQAVTDGRLHLWLVRRPDARRDMDAQNYCTYLHTIQIEGYRAYTGAASQQAMDDEIDAVLSLLDDEETLGGTASAITDGPALQEARPYALYNHVVHYARITLVVDL